MKKLIFTLLLFTTTLIRAQTQEEQENRQSTPKATSSIEEAENPYVHKDYFDKQETIPTKLPNYGSLVIDWGFNFLSNSPNEMYAKNIGARFTNLGLYYNIRLGNSKFTLSPGMGLSFEGYKLERSHTLKESGRNNGELLAPISNNGNKDIILSVFDVRYLDFMLETRFNSNSKYPKEGFFIALGGKLSLLWKACATVKYQEGNEIKEINDWQSFNLGKMRCGLQVRLGWDRFGLCYTYFLSSLFNEGNSTVQPYHLGLSIDIF